MRQTNFLDNLKTMVDVLSTSPYLIGLILVFILLAILFATTNQNNAKKTKIIYSIVYLVGIGTLLVIYRDSVMEMIDYLMMHLFIFIYFPNLAAYIAGIIITNIILFKTVFNKRREKLLRIINSILYCILHYLFILILTVVKTNELEIFSDIAIVQNPQVHALLRLSSTIFIFWIIFLMIYRIIRSYQTRNDRVDIIETIKYVSRPLKIRNIEVPNVIRTTQQIKVKSHRLIEAVLPPFYIYSKYKVGVSSNNPINNQFLQNPIINPQVIEIEPIIKNIETETQSFIKNVDTTTLYQEQQTKDVDIFGNFFTLEEYKLMNEALKNQTEEKKDIIVTPLKKKNPELLTDLESLY